ncbi:E3 ubiquitin-protein ligase SH3RF1 isoform X4 [Diabrotica virgifera virgifera]|uniref:RING-type E3 ubiquitin transferase n=1 Tax=Diabrotica virgifera virgifera TaxID=50390 RepID=A0ABM5K0S4_DIAVI|nr:E3 ubiquitin-protein ligase SH3RF1 isoform X4 [Diabrotica virgifera virgifera]
MDEGTLNDLLECSVCLERLDTSSKVLPCQHTFCKKCLEEIVQTHKELRCPECRVLVLVKVDELPPNVLLMRILEGIKNAGNFLPKKINRPARAPNLLPTAVAHTTPLHTPHSTPDHRINSNKQQLLPHQPYAKAMYDYTSKETGDLNFKRGDVIILKKRIDTNWYQGECGGKQGVFPLSYVQIITPVPSHIPQCKALYDFRMANDEEEGCLSFNKGDIISVIRRVDENWAEGKLNGRIGIFPLAFVELNNLARSLMKLSTNAQPGPSRVAPPTPTSEDTSPLIPTDHTRNVIPQQVQQQPPVPMARAPVPNQQHAPLAASDSSSTLSSGTSGGTSNISSANASSGNTSSSSSSPSPSSPASPPPPKGQQTLPPKNTMSRPDLLNTGKLTTPQRSPQNQPRPVDPHVTSHHPHQHSKEKRHSFTGLGTTHHPNPLTPNQNRLSAEIVQGSDSQMAISNDRRGRAGHLSEMQLPATYVALYPYKPQKADELELKKGGIYMVTEICHDGWYKGTSNRTQKCGVFPGNYVTPARGVPNPQGAKDSAESKLPSKERKEKGTVSLMKRLTSMKRSKSPPPSSYSMDNPVFEDTSMQAAKHSATPVHVRSGSCPSQLLQIQPNDHHRIFGSTSQRHKHKERPTILTHSPSITTRNNENPAGSSGSSPDVQRHRKSNSLDAGNKSKTVVQTVRERFRCIAPYPPNSEYELELQVNDIIYVHKKREDGWYKGTQQRTGKTGLFPASFVESY